jgi:Family of unknown function (DUF6311)
MISEKQVRPIETRVQRFKCLVLIELPSWQLLILAATGGALWAASLFDWNFVSGRNAFWQFPQGTIGNSAYDMAQVLVGYLYHVQSPWHLPLFYVSALGPVGTNIVYMDVVPVIALAGKLIHSLTSTTVNLYGGYLFLCFALPGVMMALVLIAANIRYGLAAIVGAIFANAMPALLWRWGHIALEAHFLLIGALALYLFSLTKPAWSNVAAVWIGYLILTYLTDINLFAMVGTVWLCAVIQRRLNRASTTQEALRTGVLTVASVLIVIILGGQFGSGGGPLPFDNGYGVLSMNLLSPFVPQKSGLLPGLGGVIDATGSQYEGFNYLGLGLLLATLIVLPAEIGWLRQNLRRHVALFIALLVFTAFAVSNVIFIGHWRLFELPIPHDLNRILGIFRSSGRFFWLVGYAQLAIVIVLGFRRTRPIIALCLAGAAILQLCDVQPLRAQIIASVAAGPRAEELDGTQVARLISGARYIEVIPSWQCSNNEEQLRANMELMLATARANVPINSVYVARESYGLNLIDVLRTPFHAKGMLRARAAVAYCERETEQVRHAEHPGEVFVLLSDQPPQQLAPNITCSSLSWARYCRMKK